MKSKLAGLSVFAVAVLFAFSTLSFAQNEPKAKTTAPAATTQSTVKSAEKAPKSHKKHNSKKTSVSTKTVIPGKK